MRCAHHLHTRTSARGTPATHTNVEVQQNHVVSVLARPKQTSSAGGEGGGQRGDSQRLTVLPAATSDMTSLELSTVSKEATLGDAEAGDAPAVKKSITSTSMVTQEQVRYTTHTPGATLRTRDHDCSREPVHCSIFNMRPTLPRRLVADDGDGNRPSPPLASLA